VQPLSPPAGGKGPIVPCPACRRPSRFVPDNRWRPFCSERCKLGDLGAWASDAYVIPGGPIEDDSEAPAGLAPAGRQPPER